MALWRLTDETVCTGRLDIRCCDDVVDVVIDNYCFQLSSLKVFQISVQSLACMWPPQSARRPRRRLSVTVVGNICTLCGRVKVWAANGRQPGALSLPTTKLSREG